MNPLQAAHQASDGLLFQTGDDSVQQGLSIIRIIYSLVGDSEDLHAVDARDLESVLTIAEGLIQAGISQKAN